MESDKYKKHLIRSLNNKKTEYMPSISSISDLSLEGKDTKWSRPWNVGVHGGAENSHEDDHEGTESGSLDGVIKDFGNKVKGDEESANCEPVTRSSVPKDRAKESKTEFEKYKARVKDRYKRAYREKYLKLKNRIQIQESADIDTEGETEPALPGPAFWPTYYKTLKEAYLRDKLADELFDDSLSELISDACYDVDTRNLCPRCKYNHIRDVAEACNSSNGVNSLDIFVTKSKSGKVIDSFTVNLDPRGLNKTLLNTINISIRSTGTGRMEAYDSSRKLEEVNSAPPPKEYHIEPPFSCKTGGNSNRCFAAEAGGFNQNRRGEFPEGTAHDQDPIPHTRVSFGTGNCQNQCVIETLKTQKSHDGANCPGSVNVGKPLSPASSGLPSYSPESRRFSNFDLKPQSVLQGPRKTNVTPQRYGNSAGPAKGAAVPPIRDADGLGREGVECKLVNRPQVERAINVTLTTNANNYGFCDNDAGSGFDHAFTVCRGACNASPRHTNLVSEQVTALLKGDLKLHAFMVNNKGVKVPLFLNVGSNDSTHAGQGFVSTTAIGLFKISVVGPIEPKVSVGSKIYDFIGLNARKGRSCKCPGNTQAQQENALNSLDRRVFKGLLGSLGDYAGIPWLRQPKPDTGACGLSEAASSCPSDARNVCDFHKNLFNHRVDEAKFGKDLFCQIKFVDAMTADTPLSLAKDAFTRFSNLSSFFNGFHEQLLCVGATRELSKFDLYNNHSFTFIVRPVRGAARGRNFAILNTTTGQHLCIDLLTYDLKFERESSFSRYLVPAVFKIVSLPTVVDAAAKNVFGRAPRVVPKKQPREACKQANGVHADHIFRCPTHASTTDQFVNIACPPEVGVPAYNITAVVN